MNIQFKIVKFYFLTIIGSNADGIGQDLSLNIFTKVSYGFFYILIWRQCNTNTVCDFKTTVLSDVLYAVNDFTSHAFLLEFVSKFYFKSNGKRPFVGNKPSGNILANDFNIGQLD